MQVLEYSPASGVYAPRTPYEAGHNLEPRNFFLRTPLVEEKNRIREISSIDSEMIINDLFCARMKKERNEKRA